MKAISVVPGTKNVRLVDRPEPSISAADEIKVRVLRVGICGTDREEAAGGRAQAPPSHKDLVLGHEMFGQVVETGPDVKQVKSGDYAVFTVRRGCGKCRPCAMNRSDMCKTGLYSERGIAGMDGYQTEYVVDHEQYVVRVPPELEVGTALLPGAGQVAFERVRFAYPGRRPVLTRSGARSRSTPRSRALRRPSRAPTARSG